MLKNIVIIILIVIVTILAQSYYQLKDNTSEEILKEYKYISSTQPQPLVILKNICKEINEKNIDYNFKILGEKNIIDPNYRLLETFHNIYSVIIGSGLQLHSFGKDSLKLNKDINQNCSAQYARYLISKYYYNSLTYAYLLRYYVDFNDFKKTKEIYYKLRKSFAFIKSTKKFPLDKHPILYMYINEALSKASQKYSEL